MSYIYYPSCKFTNFSPESSKMISEYLAQKHGMVIEGCCRPNHRKMTVNDTSVCVCNTCAQICREDSDAQVISLWEFLLRATDIKFPDMKHEKITLQDCWRCYDQRNTQNAVREILYKMNVEVIEMAENFEKTKFCGTTLYQPVPKENAEFAPKRFVEEAGKQNFFIAKTPDEQKQLMQEHCAQITTEKVVCYCVPCTQGICLGGKRGIHLLDMIFGISH